MRVAIVGAGVSGLGAARTLAAFHHEAVLFEKSESVGGRVMSTRQGDYLFDPGATSIAPRGRALEKVLFEEISTEGLCKIEAPIYIHQSLRVSPGDPAKNKIDRYCFELGNVELPRRLAEGLDVRLNSPVQQMIHRRDLFEVGGELFEAVILAIPTPEAQALIESVGESRPFQNSLYRPCLSVMLGFAVEPPKVVYHALLDPESGHPLTWLSIETLKCGHRSPEGKTALVVQLSPQFTKMYFDALDDTIIEATADLIVRLYGKAWDVAPEVAQVKRFKYSQPEMTALFDSVNRPNARLVVAGDGVMGGRVEYAYDAGVKAARLLIGEA